MTAGTSATFTVTALSPNGGTDTGYLGTVEFSSTDSQAGLPASYTFTAANAGTHTFTVTFKTAGDQAITATDEANSAIVGTEENILVQSAGVKSLGVSGFPTTDTAGTLGDVHASPPTMPTVMWPPATWARCISPAATARRSSRPIPR